MPFTGISDPVQRLALIALLEEICLAAGIEPQSPERDEAANFVMKFYRSGHRTADELRSAMNKAIRDKSTMANPVLSAGNCGDHAAVMLD